MIDEMNGQFEQNNEKVVEDVEKNKEVSKENEEVWKG